VKKASSDKITARKMWLGVATGFVLLVTAWTTFIVLAQRANVQSVTLARPGVRP